MSRGGTTHQADNTVVGITGTPGFFVGKTGSDGTIEGTFINGAQPVTTFRIIVEDDTKSA